MNLYSTTIDKLREAQEATNILVDGVNFTLVDLTKLLERNLKNQLVIMQALIDLGTE